MKDHEFRELVNTLRDVATQYHDHESLRERIRRALIDAISVPEKFRATLTKIDETLARVYRTCPIEQKAEIIQARVDIAAIFAPVPQAPSVPDGWKLVPQKPTPDIEAAIRVNMDYASCTPAQVWHASLAAAPQPERSAYRSQALDDVLAERRRQIEVKGWTPEHDDDHSNGEMSLAAGLYAISAWFATKYLNGETKTCPVPDGWPWAEAWWKPVNARRDLVKSVALGLAEIERMDRAERSAGDEREGV